MIKPQKGTTLVEFAIIGALVMIVLFGVIEIARAMFVWNTLSEATRRGARVAAVCPVNHAGIARTAVFAAPAEDGSDRILKDLDTSNVSVEYLDENGVNTAVFEEIHYVRVSITNFRHTLLIPFVGRTLDAPPFSTTLPVESLGWIPDLNTRACFGF